MKRGVLILAAAGLAVACSSNAPATSSATHPPGAAPIDVAAIQAAVTALETAHHSWQFTVTTAESGTPNFSRTINGTQRTSPTAAVSATFTQAGKPDKRYTRIGNDIWYDTGTGSYTKTTATDSAVVAQYEPYYLNGLVAAAEANGYQYEPVGDESVSGVATTHYRLSVAQVQDIVKNTSISATDWAADAWIAKADGSLLRLAWGAQTPDKAQISTGFNYVVTSLDCACPVDPPA